MTRHWIVSAVVSLGALAGTAALAKASKSSPEDEKVVRQTVAAYGPAFDKADVEAFAHRLGPQCSSPAPGNRSRAGLQSSNA